MCERGRARLLESQDERGGLPRRPRGRRPGRRRPPHRAGAAFQKHRVRHNARRHRHRIFLATLALAPAFAPPRGPEPDGVRARGNRARVRVRSRAGEGRFSSLDRRGVDGYVPGGRTPPPSSFPRSGGFGSRWSRRAKTSRAASVSFQQTAAMVPAIAVGGWIGDEEDGGAGGGYYSGVSAFEVAGYGTSSVTDHSSVVPLTDASVESSSTSAAFPGVVNTRRVFTVKFELAIADAGVERWFDGSSSSSFVGFALATGRARRGRERSREASVPRRFARRGHDRLLARRRRGPERGRPGVGADQSARDACERRVGG